MKRAVKRALVAAVGFVPVGADATTYDFDFSTTDSVFSVTAAMTTADTPNAVGGYDVLSISGMISGPGGGTIALTPNPSQPFVDPTVTFTYDNVYFLGGGPQVDEYGILFSAGGYEYNLFSLGPTTYYLSSDNPAGVYIPGEPVTFGESVRIATATSAPEPSTWALTLLGFVGLGLAARRRVRRRKTALDLGARGAA
jgi:hypothetical protein